MSCKPVGEDNDHGHAHGGCGSQNHEEHDGHSHGAAHHAHEEETGHNHGYASYQRVDNNDDHGHGDYEERDSKGKVVTSKHAVDNNMRAAFVHVVSDAVVSLLVIVALVVAAYVPNCEYLDSTAGIVGSFVILNWAYVLAVDTSANLLDLNPDMKLTHHLREKLESDGSVVNDLHVWRLGPGHLGSIISVTPPSDAGGSGVTKNAVYYKQRLVGFRALSHTTVEVTKRQ